MKTLLSFASLFLLTSNCLAADARSYSILPADMNLAELQYTSVSTEKELANSAKVKNNADIISARYLRTFSVGDNLAAAYIQLPYTQNSGRLALGPLSMGERSTGLGDAKLFLALGVYNMPALSRQEFAQYDRNGTRGACSMALTIPTGSYRQQDIFNIGSNQYSLKSECVVSYTQDGLVAEFITGVTSYTDNKEYLAGAIKSQKNLYQSEVHVSYNFTPKFWAGVDLFHQGGAEQAINGVSSKDKMDNTLVGLSGSYTIARGQYVKLNYIKTVSSPQYAAKSDYLALTYQLLF